MDHDIKRALRLSDYMFRALLAMAVAFLLWQTWRGRQPQARLDRLSRDPLKYTLHRDAGGLCIEIQTEMPDDALLLGTVMGVRDGQRYSWRDFRSEGSGVGGLWIWIEPPMALDGIEQTEVQVSIYLGSYIALFPKIIIDNSQESDMPNTMTWQQVRDCGEQHSHSATGDGSFVTWWRGAFGNDGLPDDPEAYSSAQAEYEFIADGWTSPPPCH